MKNLLIAVLLAFCQVVSAQIKIELPETVADKSFVTSLIKAAEARQKAYTDSLFKVKGDGGTQNPPNDLPRCDRGPVPNDIFNVTTTSAIVLWDGENVFGWDYSIYKGNERVAFGSVKPTSNREPINYAGLAPGEYTLSMQGNTCKSDVYSKSFIIPKPTSDGGGDTGGPGPPPVDKDRRFEFLIGTTGGGFDPNAKHGIAEGRWEDGKYLEGWTDRIEAFKYSWGYGVSGVSLWIHWDVYEPAKGRYETAALQRAIAYCRERKLGLAVVFLAKRKKNDGFLREDQMVTFSNGTILEEGVKGQPNVGVYPGYGCDECNSAMAGAIKDIARQLKTYDRSLYMALGGGHTGELVNHIDVQNGVWYTGDFSADNLSRFQNWVKKRGLAQPGRPPMVEGPGIDWPHPNFNDPLGLEFGRFQTLNIQKHYKSFTDAVKSEYNLPCIYLYAAAANRQLQSTANANLAFIAGSGDGTYGSDGDGVEDHVAKFRVHSVNQGTFPGGYSIVEFDPDDMSHYRYQVKWSTPPYCEANPDYAIWERSMDMLFSRGLWAPHTAMAFCVDEIRGMEPFLKRLWGKWIGKVYVRAKLPVVEVNITDKYRRGEDLLQGINVYDNFTKYADGGLYFWGGVSPFVDGAQPGVDNSKFTGYLDANLPAYGGNVLVDIKTPSGTAYSYTKGQYGRNDQLSVMSHSKLATGATIAVLISEGRLSLDTKVGDVIRSWNKPGLRDITLRQIIGHTSGIPDDQTNEGAKTLEQYVDWLAGRPGFKTPGAQYSYSTVSYQVAARMAEIVTGQPWKEIFNSRIRDKSGMGNAEYNPRGPGPVYGSPENPLAGYGLKCSQNEWSNFAGMLRDGGVFNGTRVLSNQALQILKTKLTG